MYLFSRAARLFPDLVTVVPFGLAIFGLLLVGYGTAILMALYAARLSRRVFLRWHLRRILRGGARPCVHCLYSLAGLAAIDGIWRCPECGLSTKVY
jgi:hypothetical protein